MNAEYVAVAKLQADVFVTNKKPQITGVFVSAPGGIRTPNLLIRSQMLYPLSYGRVGRAGLSPEHVGRSGFPRSQARVETT
ncbi:MAG: hypothetical protein QOE16_2707 [Microbacteriaceae bacterium]|nr:hypothetical protein [Microbacteriaceae bacterium]